MNNYAPIVLFAYNRPWHTRKVLEALAQNVEAKDSILYAFCDGAKEGAIQDEVLKIAAVRKLIEKENRFKKVVIKIQEKNKGLANSVIDGVTEVVNVYEKVIVLEDDIVVGKYFLKFMNEGLNIYEKEEHVFGITGFKYPSLSKIKVSTYFLPIASSWSYATWANRWDKVNFNGSELLKVIKQNRLKSKMNFGNYKFYEMLENQIEGKNDSWAIRFYASMFLADCFFLFPNNSLVENIGFDNSGSHCGTDDYFGNIEVTNEMVQVNKLTNSLNSEVVNLVKESFKLKNSDNVPVRVWSLKKSKLIKTGKSIIKKILGK